MLRIKMKNLYPHLRVCIRFTRPILKNWMKLVKRRTKEKFGITHKKVIPNLFYLIARPLYEYKQTRQNQ